MITVYPYGSLGRANHGWLDARHHFSFANYYDNTRMGFGVLRVINDDIIQAGRGFDTHPHQNMEIITYVREGAITHRDSRGNEGRTEAGDVQVMSAGTGIYHSEFNLENIDTRLFQIWIEPNQPDVEPRWDSHVFPKDALDNVLPLLVSGDGRAPLHIHQDAYIYAGKIMANSIVTQTIKHQVYLLVSEGELVVEGESLKRGDGLEVTEQTLVDIKAVSDAEVLIIDVPKIH